MSEGFDKLKDIGAQKIHEATHISRAHVQAFLHECFDDMSKIQFLGFVSILEREYSVDLSELKSEALEHFDTKSDKEVNEDGTKVFVSKKKRNFTVVYIAVAVIIFIAFAMSTIMSSNNTNSNIDPVDNSAIESARNNMAVVLKDINNSAIIENNETVPKLEIKDVNLDNSIESKQVSEVKKESNEIISFKIIPTHEVWLGYIDLETYEKGQKIFSDEFSLDPNKDWLLAFGHGHISVEINGIIKKYEIKKNVRFLYKNRELKEVNYEEFKSLNRGSGW